MKIMSVDYGAQVADLLARMVKPGLLLVVPNTQRQANVMTIGWGFFGYVWDLPMCAVMVRPSRYSHDLMNRAGVFTVNRMPDSLEKAVARCGSVSGRDIDKIAEQGWEVRQGDSVPAPYLLEAELHLECRTIYTTKVTPELPASVLANFYPADDLHTIYFAHVLGVYRHN